MNREPSRSTRGGRPLGSRVVIARGTARSASMPLAALLLASVVLSGCGRTAAGTTVSEPSRPGSVASTSTSTSTSASTSAVQPNLILDVEFTGTSPEPSQVDLVASITAVLGDVDELSDVLDDAPDSYVGMLDGRYRVSMTLPGATPQQLAAADRALVGTRKFALRPVTSARVDDKLCATLLATPEPDRMCAQESQEVLTLGTELGVLPTGVRQDTAQQAQVVTLDFSATDAKTIAVYTAAHVGDRLAVTDGLVLVTAPTINAAIPDGRVAISGALVPRQAAAMVGTLQLAVLGATISDGS